MSINHTRDNQQDAKAHSTIVYSCHIMHAYTVICITFQKRFKIDILNTTSKSCTCWV